MNDNGFMLFASQRDMLRMLTDEQAGQLIRALYAYNDGESIDITDQVVLVAFAGIRASIDRAREKSEKMRQNRVGKTKQNKTEQNITNDNKNNKTEQKGTLFFDPKEKERSKEKENSGVINQDLITPLPLRGDPQGGSARSKKAKPAKKTYGEFGKVMLTDDEYAKLCDHFGGEINAGQWIARLDGYIASKGDKYKSHYATILNWERGDGDERKQTASTVPRQGYLSDAERRTQQNKAVCRQVSAELDAIDSPF